MKFSSRLRVIIVVFIAVLFSLAAIFTIEKLYIEPSLIEEHEKRVSDLPVLLAIANQKAIISNDLAMLNTSIEQIISALGVNGLRYIIIEDADGKIIADGYHISYTKTDQAKIHQAIRKQYVLSISKIKQGKQDTSVVATERMGEAEREAIEGSVQAQLLTQIPEGYLPKIERNNIWRLDSLSEPLYDQSIPITTGVIRFGGLRVGTADELSKTISQIRFITWTTIVLLIVAVGGLGLTVANQIDEKFASEMMQKVSETRKELESRIKQLEIEYSRREEENPITPNEFLSLLDFARKVSGSLDYNEVLQIGIHSVLQIMGVRDSSIFVMDQTGSELVGRIGHDENGIVSNEEMSNIKVPVGKGDIGTAAEFGTTTTIDTPRPGSAVVSALVSKGRTIGVILVRNKLNGRPFLKKDQTILRIFSGLLANAMDTAAIYHHLTA